jgi:peptidyl-prolyl cis-trans isomerase C
MKRPVSFHAASGVALAAVVLLAGCSGGPAPSSEAGATAKASRAPSTRTEMGRPGVWRPGKPDTLGPVIAVFGDRRLTRHDVDSVIATAPPDVQQRLRTFDGYKQLVQRMIFEESILRLAERDRIDLDSTYKAEVANAIRGTKMRTYYNRRIASLPQPTDSMVRAAYDAHLADYRVPARVRVRHIQVATQAEANAVRRRLAKGGLWDEICKTSSQDKLSKDRGGLVGYVSKDTDLVPGIGNAPAIVKAAFSLKEGEISQPLKGPKSWHLIKADNREEPTTQSFESVRARLRTDLESKIVDDFSNSLTDSLKGVTNAAIFDDSITVAISPAKSPVEVFKEAQSAVNPQDRIELYKKLIQRFPNDSVSVQARFMIGFTYAEDIGDYEEAKAAFEEFVRLYPNSELVGSARWMIENMEKPPPPLQEDAAPSDSTNAPSGNGGGAKPNQARRIP